MLIIIIIIIIILGGVHKNRKDQILAMQGWRAESNKTWKTPLGISSPRTHSMLNEKSMYRGQNPMKTNLIE